MGTRREHNFAKDYVLYMCGIFTDTYQGMRFDLRISLPAPDPSSFCGEGSFALGRFSLGKG